LEIPEFLLFDESREVKKDVPLTDRQGNGKRGGYGNEGIIRVGY